MGNGPHNSKLRAKLIKIQERGVIGHSSISPKQERALWCGWKYYTEIVAKYLDYCTISLL